MIIIDFTTTLVIIGTTLLGITAGSLGVFITLRGHSLLGDAISHAAFPGIVAAFLLTYSRQPWILMAGGFITSCLGALAITYITTNSWIKKDAALGMVLSVFFGTGIVLMTILQRKPIASQAILTKFLFGNASTLLLEDIYAIGIVSLLLIIAIIVFSKEFSLLIFDYAYAQTIGYPVFALDVLLVFLLICAIMVGLQTVGVILMSFMMIAPAIAARQWSYSLPRMIGIAALCGAVASITGSIASSWYQLPTGPVIVVILTGIVLLSLYAGPRIGIGK